MASFLSRYENGEYTEVWAELLALGAQIREEPLYSDALAVARETMRRVRYNIELLLPRLTELGYQFGSPDIDTDSLIESYPPVFSPPAANVNDLIARLEREAGPLPLSLQVFYQVVGGVNLEGMDPDWPYYGGMYGLDPLLVYPLDEELVEECLSLDNLGEGEEPYRLAIAPDHYHKYGISGGPPYEIAFPDPAIDALLLNEWHKTSFVNYLRICFEYGGMPGLDACSRRPGKELAYLTKGFLFF